MRVGVNLLNFGPGASPDSLAGWTQLAETLGYHFVMISDHVAMTPDVVARYPAPYYDPFVTLAWLARATRRVELGTTVVILPYRHPLHTARLAANVDRLSGGRFIFGVGQAGVRNARRAVRAARRHVERLPGGDQDRVDERSRDVHGPLRLLPRRAHRSAPGAVTASAHLGRRGQRRRAAARGTLRGCVAPDPSA